MPTRTLQWGFITNIRKLITLHTVATSNHPAELKKAALRYKLSGMKHLSHLQLIKNNKTVTLVAHNTKPHTSHDSSLCDIYPRCMSSPSHSPTFHYHNNTRWLVHITVCNLYCGSGLRHRVVWYEGTNVYEEHTACIFQVWKIQQCVTSKL